MFKNLLIALVLCVSVSLIDAKQKISHEEKVAKRVQKIFESKQDTINDIKNNIEELQELLQKVIVYTEKEAIDKGLLEQLNGLLVNTITRLKQAQDTYFEILSKVSKSVQVKTIAKKEFEEVKEFHAKHLELFSDEILFLIKLLVPLKDIDTMTQEEITQALTF